MATKEIKGLSEQELAERIAAGKEELAKMKLNHAISSDSQWPIPDEQIATCEGLLFRCQFFL